MPELVADCPRCHASNMTFDLQGETWIGERYNWQQWFEAYCVCRRCGQGTIFRLAQEEAGLRDVRKNGLAKTAPGVLNRLFRVEDYVSLKDRAVANPPEHIPDNIAAAFKEGAICMSLSCFNAGGTMFRLCLDFATKTLMPEQNIDGLTDRIRRSLGLRLHWLFETKRLPIALQELSACVKDDGNDGAHEGTLTEVDASDLQDFTVMLLERLYTEPKRLEQAKARRVARHQGDKT